MISMVNYYNILSYLLLYLIRQYRTNLVEIRALFGILRPASSDHPADNLIAKRSFVVSCIFVDWSCAILFRLGGEELLIVHLLLLLK